MNMMNHSILTDETAQNAETKARGLPKFYLPKGALTTINDHTPVVNRSDVDIPLSARMEKKVNRVRNMVRHCVNELGKIMSEASYKACALDFEVKLDFVNREGHKGECGVRDIYSRGYHFKKGRIQPCPRTTEYGKNIIYIQMKVDMTRPISNIASCITTVFSYALEQAELKVYDIGMIEAHELGDVDAMQRYAKAQFVKAIKNC